MMKSKKLPLMQKRLFWLTILLVVVGMELIALGYQYLWYMEPCALCVQIRAWLALTGGLALGGVLLAHKQWCRWSVMIGALLSLLAAMEKAWIGVKMESGVFLTCGGLDPFPGWLRLDQWVPFMFEPRGMCGAASPIWPGWEGTSLMAMTLYALFAGYVVLFLVTIRCLKK